MSETIKLDLARLFAESAAQRERELQADAGDADESSQWTAEEAVAHAKHRANVTTDHDKD